MSYGTSSYGEISYGADIVAASGGATTHATSGTLTGQSAAIVGSAAHNIVHASTGVLIAQGSAIAGVSAHIAVHGTTGVLTGQGSLIVGSSARSSGVVSHSTTGALIGQGSIITGSSVRGIITELSNEVSLKKFYIKRGNKILLFNSAEEADAFAQAEEIANEAIEQAQKTSRRARKRLREKVYPAAETIDIQSLALQAIRFDIPVDVPQLIREQDLEELVRISLLAQYMQDEEDIEILLLA